ncbi:calcium-binding protein [Neptunomonas qingdaonensis]|uniref:Ca2+-binding protein, RTX toxin-related n=1 Tax=Neptunomonas qingdaonensis TaxID=1045558 RepID=A0A1I2PC69_9GAMM|nr:calcium-binding protein [Neptunomonas qingdaonensis]SFG13752.1 Ca2+-binding protein, RTX toxin-related [Neptunomonas qingdaonensis]
MDIKTAYNHALLAEAAYADLWDEAANKTVTSVDKVKAALLAVTSPLSETQIDEFLNDWEVVSHQANTASGFSATLFKNKHTQEYVFANRGTELETLSEKLNDVLFADLLGIGRSGIATSQAFDMYRYFKKLQTPVGMPVDYSFFADILKLSIGLFPDDVGIGALANVDQVSTAGHSLGGHLSSLLSIFFSDTVNNLSTYNGAGLGGGALEVVDRIQQLLGGEMFSFSEDEGVQYYAEVGKELTAGLGVSIGDPTPVFIEAQPLDFLNHSVSLLVDSLAVSQILSLIDPTLNQKGINNYLEMAASKPAESLEKIVNAIGDLLGDGGTIVSTDDREELHARIKLITEKLLIQPHVENPQLKPEYQGLSIVNINTISDAAADNSTAGLAYRYALDNLNPFAVTGSESLYSKHSDLAAENFSEQYLQDRAQLLTYLNIQRTTDNSATLIGAELSTYKDFDSDTLVHVAGASHAASISKQYLFGSSDADTLSGLDNDDHLFGGADNDTLKGNAGHDYLEGGKGADRLEGGDDFDTYFADDSDVISDSDHKGAVRLNNVVLTGGIRKEGDPVNQYTSADGQFIYLLNEDRLTVNGGLVIENYDKNKQSLNITLSDITPVSSTTNTISLSSDKDNTYMTEDEGTAADELILGFAGDDVLVGNAGADHIKGGTGNDQLWGGGYSSNFGMADSVNILEGGAGYDHLYGGEGADYMFASLAADLLTVVQNATNLETSKDVLSGFGGDDYIVGNSGRNLIHGGAGKDTLYGGAGDDFITGDLEAVGYDDWDMHWTEGHHTIVRGVIFDDSPLLSDADYIDLGDGNDVGNGGGGNDLILGGLGDDYILGDSIGFNYIIKFALGREETPPVFRYGNDFIEAGKGNDKVYGSAGSDVVYGGEGDDYIHGDASAEKDINGIANLDYEYHGNDVLYGDSGNDTLIGGGGSDTLYGGDGNDNLSGGNDVDYLYGGAGTDTLDGGEGATFSDGGSGRDVFVYQIGAETLTINDVDKWNSINVVGEVTGINLVLSNDNLIIKFNGNSESNILITNMDHKSTYDSAIINSIFYNGINHTITEILNETDVMGSEKSDVLNTIDVTTFSSQSEESVNTAEDVLSDSLSGENTSLDIGGGSGGGFEYTPGFELYQSGSVSNINRGTRFYGYGGDDIINAGNGDDLLEGGDGADSLYGGGGNDRIVGGALDGSSAEGDNDVAYGGAGDDVVIGAAGDDRLYGGEGDDQLQGDFYSYGEAHLPSEQHGNDFLFGGAGNDKLLGHSGDDTLSGGYGTDELIGGNGNDVLNGGHGSGDFLQGDSGNDIYLFAKGDGDTSIYNLDWGVDSVDKLEFVGEIGVNDVKVTRIMDHLVFTINSTGEEVTILGHYRDQFRGWSATPVKYANGIDQVQFADGTVWDAKNIFHDLFTTIVGIDGNNTLTGGDGNNVIRGGSGNDWLIGGLGSDTFLFGLGDGNDKITWKEKFSFYEEQGAVETLQFLTGITASDIRATREGVGLLLTVVSSGETVMLDSYFAPDAFDQNSISVEFEDGSVFDGEVHYEGDDYLVGSHLRDVISGKGGDDQIMGGKGDDDLSGGEGNDELYGDSGNDALSGGLGNDYLSGGSGDDRLWGGDGNDTLRGGSGDDLLEGGNGDDAYEYGRADGNITIVEENGLNTEVLKFLDGIKPDELFLKRNSEDLLIDFQGSSIAIDGFFDSGFNITFMDGTAWNVEDVINHLDVINYKPQANDDSLSYSINSGESTNIDVQDILANDTDSDGDTLNVISVNSRSGSVSLNEAGNNIHYIADNDYSGDAKVHYTISDGNGGLSDGTIVISVKNVISGTEQAEQLVGNGRADYIYGYAGNDVIFAFSGDDELYGGAGNDQLYGGNGSGNDSGDDLLIGGDGNDTLRGEDGQDFLQGGAGNDHYYYSAGDGVDVIDNAGGGADWILLNGGITRQRLSFSQSGDDLVIRLDNDENQQITVLKHFLGGDYAISYVQPSDGGYAISASEIAGMFSSSTSDSESSASDNPASNDSASNDSASDTSTGEGADTSAETDTGFAETSTGLTSDSGIVFAVNIDGNDALVGDATHDVLVAGKGDDTLSGLTGDDRLMGGAGSDVYIIGANNGSDTIVDTEGVNIIRFVDGLGFNDVASGLMSSGEDLILRIGSNGDQVRIENFFAVANTFEKLEFESGGELTATQLYAAFGKTAPVATVLSGKEFFANGKDNSLMAGDGNDILLAGAGDDALQGGGGDDQLFGGAGNDTYIIGSNSGKDKVIDTQGLNVIRFIDGISFNDVASGLMSSGDDLILRIASDGDQVCIENFFAVANTFEKLEFESGGELTAAQLYGAFGRTTPTATVTITDALSSRNILGDDADNTLMSGAGDDFLSGGEGSDTYVFNAGFGVDTLENLDTQPGDVDLARFEGVNFEDLWLSRNEDHLQIDVAGTDNQVTVSHWYAGSDYQLDQIEVGPAVLLNNQVDQLVSAMAAYDVPGGAGNVIPQDTKDNLQLVLAESWQVG